MRNLIIVLVFLTLSCRKEDYSQKPEIIWEKEFPSFVPTGNWKSSPVIFEDYLIVAIGDPSSLEATLYKFSKKDGSYIAKWEETINEILGCSFYIGNKYLYKNLLISKKECDKVVAINLNSMKTEWEIDSYDSQSNIYPLNEKVYTVEYSQNGLNIYEIDIEKKEKKFIYLVPPIEYGVFVEVQKPHFYKDSSSTRLVITTQKESEFILVNYNITNSEIAWEVKMNEYNNKEATPADISSTNNLIIVSSNDYISCRSKINGDYIWSKDRDISYNVEEPLVTEERTISATNKLYCYDNSNGQIIWTRNDKQDGIGWGSSANLGFMGDLFFIGSSPLNPDNGNAYWFDFDQWGNLILDFWWLPAYDETDDALYYTSMTSIYKVKKPN